MRKRGFIISRKHKNLHHAILKFVDVRRAFHMNIVINSVSQKHVEYFFGGGSLRGRGVTGWNF